MHVIDGVKDFITLVSLTMISLNKKIDLNHIHIAKWLQGEIGLNVSNYYSMEFLPILNFYFRTGQRTFIKTQIYNSGDTK